MAKPPLINVYKVGAVITRGDCPICREAIFKDSKIGETTMNDVPDAYDRHLKDKHSDVLREDASQAAARIVREATEDH
ncbi:MAG: hypothetical protein WA213_17985 [Terriglobales bacterium]